MNGRVNRLPEGGLIDRDRPLEFLFNGRRYPGYAGDTLASALIANGLSVVGRGFKYHRPRGIMAAGPEEPNAVVQLGTGDRTVPNLRATQVELYDGLTAASVNCWPSVEVDAYAAVGLLARFLPAGFFYKTFMWPRRWWPFYEAMLRHMAGLGRAPAEPDPDRYDHCHVHCDVLVVGGGPSGIAAALAAGGTGARVILAEQDFAFGGSLLGTRQDIDGAPAGEWLAASLAQLEATPEVRLLPRATVFGYYHHNQLAALERVADHMEVPPPGVPRQRLWKIRAARVVLATGAIERLMVFADNDRPGVMLAGAARTYINRFAVRAGRRAVLFVNNDGAYETALELAAAGVEVAAVVDPRPEPSGMLPSRVLAADIEVVGGHAVVAVKGRKRVRAVDVAPLGEGGRTVSGAPRRVDCDLLCVSGGWNPAVHLFSQSGGRLRYDQAAACFVPGQSQQAEVSAGAANGAWTLDECLDQGFAAGARAAGDAGFRTRAKAPRRRPAPAADEEPGMALWSVPATGRGGGDKHFVDLAGDVTVADIALAAREGYQSIEHVKRYTALGMSPDQGKLGNVSGLAILSEILGRRIPEVGTTTFRPPFTPVTYGALAGRHLGDLAEPQRLTPMHHWHRRMGAPFEDVGQWKRPWYYPLPGETMGQAVERESLAARASLGILDASTLGKIDIRGRDAATFLNRVYTNAWDKLKVGRCRYGLMLGEDGMVMDDGVTARLGEHHYLMTTTTGNAARVMSWLEEWLQTEWPDLEVYLTSVTEQWATVTLCGPNARRLMAELTVDIDLGAEAFPFMAVRLGTVAGLPARVFRVSFTGELSYEVNVPADAGMALWTAAMNAGEKFGITPFGTETMHLLRAEKGFIIVGQETDGSVTPGDLGMDWILSKKKDFLGRRSLSRPDCLRSDRKQLVGLVTEDPNQVLPEGGQIIAPPDMPPPVPMVGRVTSSYASPNVGRSIALALVEGGRKRLGETLLVPLPGRTVKVTVTGPVFFDPEGTRTDG